MQAHSYAQNKKFLQMIGRDEKKQALIQEHELLKVEDHEFDAIKMNNLGNMAYMSELFLGAPHSQKIERIVFDTGSDILAIMSTNC